MKFIWIYLFCQYRNSNQILPGIRESKKKELCIPSDDEWEVSTTRQRGYEKEKYFFSLHALCLCAADLWSWTWILYGHQNIWKNDRVSEWMQKKKKLIFHYGKPNYCILWVIINFKLMKILINYCDELINCSEWFVLKIKQVYWSN